MLIKTQNYDAQEYEMQCSLGFSCNQYQNLHI